MIHYKDLRSVHFEVSSYCNSSCPTCPRNIEGGLVSDLLKPNSLSIDDVKKIFPVEFVKQLTFINFCGNYGDPMMAKDIYEIIEYSKEFDSIRDIDGDSYWQEVKKEISKI